MADAADLTIDQLAQRTGMTVRNLRAHQSRGLLQPPEVRARTGFYGEEHVARIELIKELQADGVPLDLIKRMVEQAAGSTSDLLRFMRVAHEPFSDEEPVLADVAELTELFGPDPALLEKAQRLGLLRPLGDGRFEVVSPRLIEAGRALGELGVEGDKALEVVGKLRRQADAAAKAFVELYLEEVWKPFDRDGRPDDRWPEVSGAMERLRPLAADAVTAMFQIAMGEAVEKAFGREIARGLGEKKRPRR
jgi:DNA-binding transcriptional MerR regulator